MERRSPIRTLALTALLFTLACTPGDQTAHGKVALAFAEALRGGRYADAHTMLSSKLKQSVSAADLERSYRDMTSYGTGPANQSHVITTMTYWPDKQPEDIGWAYVAIIGSDFNEAVTVVVATESDRSVIRSIEWGRP